MCVKFKLPLLILHTVHFLFTNFVLAFYMLDFNIISDAINQFLSFKQAVKAVKLKF